jgi:thiol-disulfide isomerase/thioredoxin
MPLSTVLRRALARRAAFALAIMVSIASRAPAAPVQEPLSGTWDASIDVGSISIPFKFGISSSGTKASGWFFNGQQRVASTSGTFEAGHLQLEFPSYARRLEANLGQDGTLSGSYGPNTESSRTAALPFHAAHDPRATTVSHDVAPSIAGLWLIPAQSRKAGEKAWRFIVRQSGAEVSAAILRVDGDTGALTGTWHEGKLVLSHFDGARPALIDVTLAADGSLQLLLHDTHGANTNLTAYRDGDAQSKGLPEAADPMRHTGVTDAAEPFRFSAPDLSGRVVSNTDARFRGKVLLVDISGSWCPNCHDEAPLLQRLYRKYHRRGLEIVTLSFEEPEQVANPVRLRAFVKDFGLGYEVLLAGSTDELHAKVPQAVNLDAYPTTFFIGRDGRVHGVHAGFAAPATGEFNRQLQKDFNAQIERLLAAKPMTTASAS